MNKDNSDIINKFLFIGDKFMPDMYLYQPKIVKHSACGPFTRHQQRIHQFMKDGKLSHIAKNKLDAACFQHDAAYNMCKDLKNRTQSDIVLKNKTYKIAADPKYDGYQRLLASMVYKFFDKRPKGSGMENKQLADELRNQLLETLIEEKCILAIKIILGVLI